jgi:hypothetical protein
MSGDFLAIIACLALYCCRCDLFSTNHSVRQLFPAKWRFKGRSNAAEARAS